MLMPLLAGAQAEDIFSEDDIFSEEETVVEVEESQNESITDDVTGESVSFSGSISPNFGYTVTRDCLDGDEDWGDNPYSTSVDGDFLLDVRLRNGIKSFANFWATYTPQENEEDPEFENFDTILKEFFVDVNIARKVYFRFGKQNLKWGQGYLWNPTDLISEDRKDFDDIDARREGVYGLKAHVPFGTMANLYGFVNAANADTVDEFSVAGKAEFLVLNDIELSFSAWKKQDYKAVFGMDAATYKLRTNWRAEMSLSQGDNRSRLEQQNGEYVDIRADDDWMPRFTLGFTRMFDVGNFNDRLSVTGEFYYNHGGYDDDMLADDTRDQFLEGGYFEPGSYGKYYAALFSNFGRFIVTDMTLNVNAIGNLSDSSFIFSTGIDYLLTFNAILSAKVDAYLGDENQEYTLAGNALSAEVSMNLIF